MSNVLVITRCPHVLKRVARHDEREGVRRERAQTVRVRDHVRGRLATVERVLVRVVVVAVDVNAVRRKSTVRSKVESEVERPALLERPKHREGALLMPDL